jgi:hypothetical protein
MPKKSAKGKGKKRRASTEKISINIKNIMKQHLGDRSDTREVPDFIRPLGKRPIESQAYDNRYRLLNPAVTYMSTPLSSMYALRDVVNAPALPQISGEPQRLRQDIQPVEVNPMDIERSRPSRVAVKANPLLPYPPPPRESTFTAPFPQAYVPKQQPEPILGQRFESSEADKSQLLVALQMDQEARQLARMERERMEPGTPARFRPTETPQISPAKPRAKPIVSSDDETPPRIVRPDQAKPYRIGELRNKSGRILRAAVTVQPKGAGDA